LPGVQNEALATILAGLLGVLIVLAAASALASLGALGNAAGAAATLRTPGDQYLALLQSTTIADRLISEFKLMEVYDEDNLVDTRRKLDRRVDMSVGKKDGLITIEVDDKDPTRAAAMARRYVDELRRLTSRLALTEAQQRRVFFEAQLAEARDRLTQAQLILQGSGFGAGALRAEPRAAAEAYARVKAEVTATEIRLQVLRRSLADHTPEVQQQLSVLAALRSQLARLETVPEAPKDWQREMMESVICQRYAECRPTVFTSNHPLATMTDRWGERVGSRLVEMLAGNVVEVGGADWRRA